MKYEYANPQDDNQSQKDFDKSVVIATNEQLKNDRFAVAPSQAHTHNGSDAVRIPYQNLTNKFFFVPFTLPGTTAATAANYGTFFTAQAPCLVTGFTEVHETAGTDPGSVTLQLEKLTGTTAPNSGTNLLQTALSLKATANTVQTGTLVKTSYTAIQTNTVFLNIGDRLALKDSGTLTGLVGVNVVVKLVLYP